MSGTVGGGQTLTVSAGQTDAGTTVLNGGSETVLAGGVASATVLDAGGTLVISSGAVDIGTVLSGGTLYVYSGAVMSSLVVSSGHQGNTGQGVVADGTVVSSGGTFTDYAGGIDSGTVLDSGGTLYVSSGGVTIGTVLDGGTLYVFSGGVTSGLVVSSGHHGNVGQGVVADGTVVSNGGSQTVLAGGVDSGAVVASGGLLYVSSGGIDNGAVLEGGGTMYVSSGGVAVGTVLAGGTLYVLSGGVMSALVLSSGHHGNVGQGVVADGTVVSGGGTQTVLAGGLDSGTVVSSGGILYVSSGGIEIGAEVKSGGAIDILAGGIVSGLLVDGGGIVEGPTLSTGASASATYTAAAGAVTLDAGLTVADSASTTLAGATVSIGSGFQSGDVLAAATTGTAVTASYNGATGVLTLSGTDTPIDYQHVLDSVTFASTASPLTASRTIAWAVNDGTAASPVATSTVAITHSSNLPVITVQNQTVGEEGSIQASTLIASVTDPNNQAITYYDFRDDGGGGGYFTLNGRVQAVGSWITVSAANLSQLVYHGSSGAGTETVDVAAWDGANWSNYQTATVTTQAAGLPAVTAQNQTVGTNQSIQASTLIASVADPNNLAIADYDFRDQGGGGGSLVLDGVVQTAGTWITVGAAQLSQLVYRGGTAAGSETIDVAAWDGLGWSNFQVATVTTTAQQGLPVLVAQNQTVTANATLQASALIASVTDPDNLAITAYQFRDDGGGAGYFTLNGVVQATGAWIAVSAANLSQLVYNGGSGAGTETVDLQASDGANWSQVQTAEIVTNAVLPPLVSVQDQTVAAGATLRASALIASVTDPHNDAITAYQFRDDGGGAGYFSLGGAVQATGAWITVNAANLAQLIYHGGSGAGTETVDVEASNGLAWSAPATATIITQAGQTSNPPVLTVQNQTLVTNSSIQASSLIGTVSDPNNFAITTYDFRDDGGGGGYFMLNGIRQPGATWITVTAANLANLLYVGGAAAGAETINVAAFDGHAWSATDTATITTTVPGTAGPVVTVANQTVGEAGTIQASALIASVTDPNNLAITAYDFKDDGGGGGYFAVGGVSQAVGSWFTVSASQLAQVTYVGGAAAGTETVNVAASDGVAWSPAQTATITTAASALPDITVQNTTVAASSSIQASALIAGVTDPGNNAITSYEFRDDGGGGGGFTLNGAAQPVGGWITVSAANLAQLLYVGGASAGTETVDIAAFDGQTWSNYATATVTTYGPASVAAVIAELTDSGIKADVTNDLVNNTLSYAAMLSILQDVATSAAAGGLTAAELSSLRTLVANFNTNGGIQTSQYVDYISNALINGNPANKDWTDGAATTTTLLASGNLAAGATQTQLNELIQKWFLGGDLPNAAIPTDSDDYGDAVTYIADANPLFNNSGTPSVGDINQGQLGDCYLLASLAEIAQMQPSAITSMFTSDGNGVYGVRFYVDGAPVYVTVNDMLPYYANDPTQPVYNDSSDTWASLIEKAYVELNQEPGVLGADIGYGPGNSYALIEGGDADPITSITGRQTTAYNADSMSLATWTALQQTIVTAIQGNFEVDFGTGSSVNDVSYAANGQMLFEDSHMYSTLQYDATTGDFIVRNPWGGPQTTTGSYEVEFEASMAQLYAVDGTLYVANGVSAAQPSVVVTPPIVTTTGAIENFLESAAPVPVVLDPGVAVQDSGTTLASATVSIGAGLTASDRLTAVTLGSIVQSYNSASGVLTLSGTDTLANYTSVLRSVTFATSGAASGNRTISWAVNDGVNESATATSFVSVTAAGPIVANGGSQSVTSGVAVVGTTVSSGGTQYVYSGGIASATTISSNGEGFVFSGGVGSAAEVFGEVQVWAGGTASATQIENGGSEYVYGSETGAIVSGGGAQFINLGGTVSAATISGGGWQFVFGSGAAIATTVSATGNQDVYSAGATSGTTLLNTAWEIVWGGGTANAIADSGGYLDVYSGGVANGAVVSSGGWQFAWGGGLAAATTTSSGGYQDVYAGGAASGGTVSAGAWQFDWGAGTTTTATTIASGGWQDVYSAGAASGATVLNGGWQFVWGGGTTATGTTVSNGGYQDVYSGGSASGSVVSAGGWELAWTGGSVSGATISSGGIEFVWSGASAAGTVVANGGLEDVYGVATGVTVNSGGLQYVWSGGVASGTVASNGGYQDVFAGGVSSNSVIDNGGWEFVWPGGVASASTINTGGNELVLTGGAAGGATLSGGTLEVQSGATAGATVTFAGGGTLRLDAAATFTGRIAGFGVPGNIDLGYITYGAQTTVGFTEAGNHTSGTLSVSDGTHTAAITLLGQYVAANFSIASDGAAGTLVTDPPVPATDLQSLLAQPQV